MMMNVLNGSIKTERQFINDECERIIDANFIDNQVVTGTDSTLFKLQKNHVTIILEKVLKTTAGLRLSREYFDNPHELWKQHQVHQTKSAPSVQISIKLSQELAQMKIAEFPTPSKCLDTFDAKLEKFNKLSRDPMPSTLAIRFLKQATLGNTQLLNAWASCDTITEHFNA